MSWMTFVFKFYSCTAQNKLLVPYFSSPTAVIWTFLFVQTHLFLEEVSHEVLFLSCIPSFQFYILKINNVLLFSKLQFILCNFENFLMFTNGFLAPVPTLFFNILRLIIWVSIPAKVLAVKVTYLLEVAHDFEVGESPSLKGVIFYGISKNEHVIVHSS